MSETITARENYERQLAEARAQIAELGSKNASLVWLRTICFVVGLIGFLLGYGGDQYRGPLQVLAWLAAAAFVVAIVQHEHLRLKILLNKSNERLFQRLLARLDRNWSELPETRLRAEHSELTFADDLDVAGDASLLSLLSLCGTQPGRQKLQAWIAETPSWSDVQQRQRAVKLLVDQRELRLSILKAVVTSHEADDDKREDAYGLAAWASSPAWLPQHRVAHALSYVGPALVLLALIGLAIAATSANALATNICAIALGVGFLINILVTVFWGSWLHDIFLQVTGEHRAAFNFAEVFESFERLPEDDGLLSQIRHAAVAGPKSARRGFPKLLWNVRLANLQRDPIMYIVYLILQLVGLWDFRILKRLEAWKAEFGDEVFQWFEGLGTCEALVSGGTLADEYREWAFPKPVADPGTLLEAKQLGHPLLPDASRVCNDILLRSDQPLLLVTGSNMAGKSTFMRAAGLNLLLARTGSPVCASQMHTHLYELATSIRVRDSLRDGVSFFMAELKRLKEVVDLAEQRASDSSHRIFFLLDEILQGTNSNERQIAVATVLGKLISYGAVGIVSTHDLDLAHAKEVQAISQVVHFREYFETRDGQEIMRFDYRMHPGSTPTTNALKLLKLVGLSGD